MSNETNDAEHREVGLLPKQNPQAIKIRDAIQPLTTLNWWKGVIIIILAGLSFFFTISSSVLILSSYQIQQRMQSVSVGNAQVSIRMVDEIARRYISERSTFEQQEKLEREAIKEQRERQQLVLKETVNSLKQKAETLKKEIDNIQSLIDKKDIDYAKIFNPFYNNYNAFVARYRAENQEKAFEDLKHHGVSVKIINSHLAQQIKNNGDSQTYAAELTEFEKQAAIGAPINRDISTAKRNKQKKQSEFDSVITKIENAASQVNQLGTTSQPVIPFASQKFISTMVTDAIDKQLGPDIIMTEEQKWALIDAVSELISFRQMLDAIGIVYEKNFLAELPLLPHEILVLTMVIAMGVLGSTIFTSQILLTNSGSTYNVKSENLSVMYFITRLLFGAIISFTIFILAKAGVLFLTDPTSSAGSATLSPFFISFIAIISGLFSEQAIQAIKQAADKWFNQTNQFSERWGIDLAKLVKEKKRDIAKFSQALGVKQSLVEDWINGSASINYENQLKIAAWLEKPDRELFTDIAPT